MQPAYPAHQQTFPPSLEHVPAEARLAETFAFTPGALAIGGILGLVGFLVTMGSRGPARMVDFYPLAGCAFGAVIFGGWEIVRRMQRTTVVFHGDQMGLYRGAALAEIAHRSQVMVYQLSILNTIRELFAFGFLALIGVFGGVFTISRNLGLGLVFVGAGVGLSGAFISSIYARVACRHFFLPKGKTTEQVMFTRGALGRFGL